nr:RNA-directed DNA polymerase, eukaryota [Tanacetum cinerariifolium]
MVRYRSKEDDVARISTSIYVTNFADSFSAKELFQVCKQYGHVVDSFIPVKKSKEGKRFGFVRFINVFNVDRLVVFVLDEECLNSKDLSLSLMGRVKEFASISNLKTALINEGYAEIRIRYMGELWWFSEIKQAEIEFVPAGRIVWVEIEGLPFKFWSENTFERIAVKWGKLMDVDDQDESKAFWVRAKEVSGWVPEFLEESDDEEEADDGDMEGVIKNQETGCMDENSDMEEVPDTIFDEEIGPKENISEDPFGIYSILNKKTKNLNKGNLSNEQSLKYPPGFMPKEVLNGCEASRYDKGSMDGGSLSDSNVRIKKSKVSRSGGSFLGLMEEVVKVGQTMGYNIEGCVKNLSEIIESHGEGSWIRSGLNLLIVVVYGPHDSRDKRMLWDYLLHMVNQWDGEVIVMGDFNEVRYKTDKFGSEFNINGAKDFNDFIINAGLEEVLLGGSKFTWCHKSAMKMSKLDRFFISENLFNLIPNIKAITLDRYLSDHCPILLREYVNDYGPIPFRFFHHWFELEGFDNFVTDMWKIAPGDVNNGMINMLGKLKFVKVEIREWIKTSRNDRKGRHEKFKKELSLLDAEIDDGHGSETVVNKRLEVINEMKILDKFNDMDMIQKARIKWAVEGDENSKFFHGMLNRKRHQQSIRGVMTDWVWKDKPADVKMEFLRHFSNRFCKPPDVRATIDMVKFSKGFNSSFIALIPKILDASMVKDLRPICLIGINGANGFKVVFALREGLFFSMWSDSNITTLVHVLDCFFRASGLRINMKKSKILEYLGTKVGGSMNRVDAWNEVVDKVKFRLSKWKMKSLSIGGRLTLVKSVLGSMPIFHTSMFRVPRSVLNKLESLRSQFFNGNEVGSKKAIWVKWNDVLKDKARGGLSVAKVIKAIYGEDGGVDSMKIGNGDTVSFWKDNWQGEGALKNLFPRLFALENSKDVTDSEKLRDSSLLFLFRRNLGVVQK